MDVFTPRTLADKLWRSHLISTAGDGAAHTLYVDLHLVHEVSSPQAFDGLRAAGLPVRRPDLTIATEDHNVPTTDIRPAHRRSDQPHSDRDPPPQLRASSASACTRWATPSRASCTWSGRSSG